MSDTSKPRGRQVGQVKVCTTIKDPALGPYYIEVSKGNYSIFKEGDPMPIAHCSSLVNTLKRIAREYIPEKTKQVTIREYIAESQAILNKMQSFIQID